jgi:hypothetical protein
MDGPTDKPRISLRDAVVRLSPDSKNRQYSALLGHLKDGRIKAGFRFPLSRSLWVEIPPVFWLGVDEIKFNGLRRDRAKPSSGTFRVRLADFAQQISALVSQRSEPAESAKWAEVLAATRKRYDVEILAEEWERFMDARPVSFFPRPRSTRGRREKEGWRELSVVICIYFLQHHAGTQDKIEFGAASKRIREIAQKREIGNLPGADSIQLIISTIENQRNDPM